MAIVGIEPDLLQRVSFAERRAENYINRELSWLQFNWRVLEEAENPAHPLLERLRFLSISASNLDEFFTVRAAGLRQQVAKGHERASQDGMSPSAQLVAIHEEAIRLTAAQQTRWDALRKEVERAGIRIVEPEDLSEHEREFITTLFDDKLYAQLTPISVDLAHQFPFIPPEGSALGLTLRSESEPGETKNAIVPIPLAFDRFQRLPSETRRKGRTARPAGARFIRMERLIEMFVPRLFLGFEVVSAGIFRVLRDSDIEIEEEAEDLVGHSETLDRRRRRGSVIRLEVDASMPAHLREFVAVELEVEPEETVIQEGLIGLAETSQLIVKDQPELLFPPFTPRFPERIREYNGDCFAAIRAKDLIVHHPYESFDVVLQFLRQAVADPRRGRHQVDTLSHQPRFPHRAGAEGGGGGGQGRDCDHRVEGALRRIGQPAVVARSGARRRARRLRVRGAEDPRQARPGGADGKRAPAHLLPHRNRELSSHHRAHLHRPVVLHRRRRHRA